jgi:hypothetical protein
MAAGPWFFRLHKHPVDFQTRLGYLSPLNETVEEPVSERLMEKVHMQGFRNPEE